MKIPKKLKVGGRDYDVMFPHVFTDSVQILYGLHDASGQTIKVSELDEHGGVRHPQSVAQSFLHEVLHAIDNIYNGGELGALERGENMIDQLADGILQVFRDNNLDFLDRTE